MPFVIIIVIIAFFGAIVFFMMLARKDFDVFIVDLNKDELKLYWQEEDGTKISNIERLRNYLKHQGKELIFATNAGIFDDEEVPLGMHVENGETLQPINFDEESGIFYVKPNGVFYVENNQAHIVDSIHFDTSKKVDIAVQSGPMLVKDGKIHSDFKEYTRNVLIRNGVGIISPTKIAFVISKERVSFNDIASFFKDELHCDNALSLDVDISRMYIKGKRDEARDLEGNLAGILAVSVDATSLKK